MKPMTPFPLVMPKKYIRDRFPDMIEPEDKIQSYRNFYQAKVKQQYIRWERESNKLIGGTRYLKTVHLFPKWTGREKPEWLEL